MAKAFNLLTSDLDVSSESDLSVSSRASNRSLRVAEKERRKSEAEDPFLLALKYFSEVKAGTPWMGNDVLERNLVLVERMGLTRGLPPEVISTMLDYAMSLRMGAPCVRVLKFLIPATVVPQEAIVRAVAWLCVGKIAISTQVLFLKWVLTFFDMIDSKDHLRSIYGFIFNFVTEEHLCPYICHLLYLLTRKDMLHQRSFIFSLSPQGRQPFLLHLLSLYKVFCPELVTTALPSKLRGGFKNHVTPWKGVLNAIQKRNTGQVTSDIRLTIGVKDGSNSRKRKCNHLQLPSLNSAVQRNLSSTNSRKVFPLEQLHSFPELLDNLHRIELPSQMGSLLGSSLALCYLDYVQDDSAFLRLNFWLGHALHEGKKASPYAQNCVLPVSTCQNCSPLCLFYAYVLSRAPQEGFFSTESFLYKFLNVWDGSLLRPQILGLLSHIPVVPSSCIHQLLFEPLMQLFFSSTLFFKCSVIECLNDMLLKWLTWHSVYSVEDGLDISLNSHTPMNMTLSGFMDSVMELVLFVGRLATVGLQLEGCSSLLLSFVLDFYETVCDMFLKFELPLVVMPPVGVFYPALFATDPVSVDRLCFIMCRYKQNLTAAKFQQQEHVFHISSQTYREFNRYQLLMVSTLWNSRLFQPGMAVEVDHNLLALSKVPEPSASFTLIRHPAFVGYALDFHLKAGKHWEWYLEFLFSHGYLGLQQFVQSNINWHPGSGTKSQGQGDGQPTNG
uniref:Centromere protein I n=1 Tax=Esox lucius TaxID=8010 RepID=A0A6Q2ZJT6_ESOLU